MPTEKTPAADIYAFLHEDERLDDLERNGLFIIQKKAGFCFGMDAVLLSGFAKARKGERVLDLGTGTGIIPILMSAKTLGEHFFGMELQAEMADMAERSVLLNGINDRVEVVRGDLREGKKFFPPSSMDVVTSNPPYIPVGKGLANPDMSKAMSRHEISCTLPDVCREAARVLKTGGRFYMVHRPQRLAEIFAELMKMSLEPKRMKFVHPFADREADMVLIEAVKGGGRMLRVEKPVVVFRATGEYTEEIRDVYGY